MARKCLGVVLAVAASAAGGEAAGPDHDRRELAGKILLEAQVSAHDIVSPSGRNAALASIAEVMIRAGDENGALALDKKIKTTETPRPILKALALAQLHAGRIDDALFTVRTMNDADASDITLFALAHAADDSGDAELAVRMCRLVSGEGRLDALLLATRIEHQVADRDGEDAALDAAKLLAHRQAEVAKVAETEALIGNLERADRLMARLHRESDQSRVLAAMVSIEAAARDFAAADSHAADINVDSYRSAALGSIAMAHAQAGQMKDAIEQMNAIPDDDVRLDIERKVTELALKNQGLDGGRAAALGCHDAAGKSVCLSLVALATAKSGNAQLARKTMAEAQAALFPEHELPSDPALAAVAENLAGIDMPDEAVAMVEKIRDADIRTDEARAVLRAITRGHDLAFARKRIESLKDAPERTAAMVGIADGMLDLSSADDSPLAN
jgi:hypothetical protein